MVEISNDYHLKLVDYCHEIECENVGDSGSFDKEEVDSEIYDYYDLPETVRSNDLYRKIDWCF